MPLYEYKCLDCQKVQEVIQKFADAPLEVCPLCQGALKKLMSMSSFSLKGTGWHNTDYKRPSSAPSGGAPAQDTQVSGGAQAGTETGAQTSSQNSSQNSKDSGSDGSTKNGKESNGKDKAPTAQAGKAESTSGSEKKTASPSAETKSSEKSTASAVSKVGAKV